MPNRQVSSESLRDAIWAKTDGRCWYCDEQLEKKGRSKEISFCVDHAIPSSKGGRSSLVNLVPCCNNCNRKKKDKTPAEFLKYLIEKKEYFHQRLLGMIGGAKTKGKYGNDYYVKLARKRWADRSPAAILGRKGGKAKAKGMTKAERVEMARRMVAAREEKLKGKRKK
jgi:hypothetical protein